ncbi:MAG: hypothetical protein ACI3ZQ_05660 [Candidatus Cryptobacteroides sp.]
MADYGYKKPHRRDYYMEDEEYEEEDEQRHHEKLHHMKMDRNMAEEWTAKMENEDGTRGAHWSYEQIAQLMPQKNIECDPAEFYAAVNMMYSDYCKVAKQYNINTVDFYFAMAKAFLDDKDAEENKIYRYYEYIVDD